jgi:hypothetical protein
LSSSICLQKKLSRRPASVSPILLTEYQSHSDFRSNAEATKRDVEKLLDTSVCRPFFFVGVVVI